MDEQSNEIVQRIHSERNRLGENLSELETRVQRATDWRTYYYQHPYWFVGAALGGGLLLASAFSGSRGNGRSYEEGPVRRTSNSSSASSGDSPMRQVSSGIDEIKAAVVGLGIAKVKDLLNDYLPGLKEHLRSVPR